MPLTCFEVQGDTVSEDKAHYFNCLYKYSIFSYFSEVYVNTCFVVQ